MEFLRETELEKYMLNKLTEVVREYVETVYKPIDSRHRKTVMVFTLSLIHISEPTRRP